MPQLLFPDPRFRSPTEAMAMREKRAFIKHFEVRGELKLPLFEHDCTITRLCGLGQDIGLEHALRICLVQRDGLVIGEVQKYKDKQLFECPQFILNERRLNVETRIDPPLMVARTDVIKLKADQPMLVWVFGIFDVQYEEEPERDPMLARFPSPGETI